ncbi:H-NS histone family protein [Hydrogenophaga pseudoflava]|uniref:H-NS histone family protein n=1 Tax=Hydrogenophaga pseudoflava TaxID=47421 RepID=UPI0027E3FD0A|nr:H-NS histone family protein [Hydrogenophaga pseudoflava]MDQ7743271.1 H-NS histone family protein [Hydrogenophaga pseudoflava]
MSISLKFTKIKGYTMATYSELMAQAQELMNQAEQARKNELAATIADIKAKMKEYGITVADLGGATAGVKKAAKSKSKAAAKYRGPNGELWAGGPGRKPEWVRAVLAAGKSLEDFRI